MRVHINILYYNGVLKHLNEHCILYNNNNIYRCIYIYMCVCVHICVCVYVGVCIYVLNVSPYVWTDVYIIILF